MVHVVAQFTGTKLSHDGRPATVSNNLLERLNGAFHGFKSLVARNSALTTLQALHELPRFHQGLGDPTPFKVAGDGGPGGGTLIGMLPAALRR